MSILKHFPFEKMRDQQRQVLLEIEKAMKDPKIKHIILQMPVGGGKSPIGLSVAKSVPKSYILTANKILQDQYLRDFDSHISDLRGRANYNCTSHPGYNCSTSPCRATPEARKACATQASCGYHKGVQSAKEANIASLNFAAAFAFWTHTENFVPRDLLIVDEAHLIEENITNLIEFSVNKDALAKWDLALEIPEHEDSIDYLEWLQLLKTRAHQAKENFKLTGESNFDQMIGSRKTFEEIEGICNKLEFILSILEEDHNNLVVDIIYNERPKYVDKISFKPIDVSEYAEKHLFAWANKTLFMSATIIHYEQFIESLGISRAEAVFIDVPSTFPAENRPILKNYVDVLNSSNMQNNMPKIIQEIEKILKEHKNEKGIIHTHSYDTARKITIALMAKYGNRILFPEKSYKQKEILAEHSQSKLPTVIISPSMTEGVDLKDDLGRFQIIVKMPYPYLGDKVVKARMNKNPNWYSWRTLLTLIQSYGRTTRSETDQSVTYVLDGAFEGLVARNKRFLPKWFTEAIYD